MQPIDPREIPQDVFEAKIREIRDKRQKLALQDGALAREQAWWEQGLAIFIGPEATGGRIIREPTLRESIVLVFQASDREKTLKPSEIIEALERRGRLSGAKSAPQMVRNRLHSMVEKKELNRDALGYYSLAPDIRNTGLLRLEPEMEDLNTSGVEAL